MFEKNKYFIITTGPVGSGKTRLINKTMEYLNIPSGTPFEKILIDDLVENDPKYKQRIKNIIQKVKNKCNNDKTCELKEYNNPSDDLYKKFSNAYYFSRKTKGCIDEAGPSCDKLNDYKMKAAIKEGKNIIFEFTGNYIPTWLLDTHWIPKNYNIIFSYSLINPKIFNKRNKTRTYNTIQQFYIDNTKPAPRLPILSYKTSNEILVNIQNILIELYDSCIINYDENKCGKRNIDQLLVFDNNGTLFKKIFDSSTDKNKINNKEKFKAVIIDSFREKNKKTLKNNKQKNTTIKKR
jgi:hypothetical protein